MRELDYWRNLARNLLLNYEKTVIQLLCGRRYGRSDRTPEASETVRESFQLSLDEYEFIRDKDWEAAYQEYLSKEENEYT